MLLLSFAGTWRRFPGYPRILCRCANLNPIFIKFNFEESKK